MRYVAGRLLLTAAFGAVLLGSTGDWGWARGWLYLVSVSLCEVLSAAWLQRANAEVLRHRGGLPADAKPFDRAFAAAWLVLALLTPLVAGLDVRLAGGETLTRAWIGPGLALLVATYVLATWAMGVNRHFELLVRMQEDRGHRVVTTGPYRWVRHPGYLAAIVGGWGAMLVLGSLWALIPALCGTVLFAVRTALEDRTLHESLPGYAEYAAQTRYRLIVGVW